MIVHFNPRFHPLHPGMEHPKRVSPKANLIPGSVRIWNIPLLLGAPKNSRRTGGTKSQILQTGAGFFGIISHLLQDFIFLFFGIKNPKNNNNNNKKSTTHFENFPCFFSSWWSVPGNFPGQITFQPGFLLEESQEHPRLSQIPFGASHGFSYFSMILCNPKSKSLCSWLETGMKHSQSRWIIWKRKISLSLPMVWDEAKKRLGALSQGPALSQNSFPTF